MAFDEGPIAASLAGGVLPARSEVQDAFGFATGAFEFALQRRAATERRADPRMPARRGAVQRRTRPPSTGSPGSAVEQWSGNGWCALRRGSGAHRHHAISSSPAPVRALQPGPRRYTRSWIRDGAMMSAALLRMGHAARSRGVHSLVRAYQRADGFVPCCVDRAGPGLAGRARQSRRADRAHRRSLPLHGGQDPARGDMDRSSSAP